MMENIIWGNYQINNKRYVDYLQGTVPRDIEEKKIHGLGGMTLEQIGRDQVSTVCAQGLLPSASHS